MDDVTVNSGAGAQNVPGESVASSQATETAGANEGQVTEAPISNENGGVTAETNTVSNGADDGKPRQSAEDNARFAEQRRKYAEELQRRRQGEAERTKAAIDAEYAKLGLRDRSGKPITTKEQYEASQREAARADKTAKLRRMGLDADTFDSLISEVIADHPDVKAAREAAAEAQRAKEAADSERARQAFDASIKEIGEKYDPNIKSFADLAKTPEYPQISKYVRENGLSIKEAYEFVNREKIYTQGIRAAKQSAINDVTGKAHLNATGAPKGQGAVTVPARTLRMYMSQGMSKEDATAAYNRFLNDHK